MSQFGDFQKDMLPAFVERMEFELEYLVRDIREQREVLAAVCESPIELALAESMILESIQNYCLWRMPGRPHEHFGKLTNRTEIAPQFKIQSNYRDKTYRVDFAIMHTHPYGTVSRYVVECDGHDYHERTKEQAARDRKKDRDLQSLGWKILRFTGSEIHKDPGDCAHQIFHHIGDDSAEDYLRARYEGRIK